MVIKISSVATAAVRIVVLGATQCRRSLLRYTMPCQAIAMPWPGREQQYDGDDGSIKN